MTATATGGEVAPLRIGRVIASTFGEIRRGWLTFTVLALLFVGLPNVGLGFADFAWSMATYAGTSSEVYEYWSFGARFLGLLTESALYGSVIYACEFNAGGRRPSILAAGLVGLRLAPAIFVVRFASVALMLGLPFAMSFTTLGAGGNELNYSPLIRAAAAAPGVPLFVCLCLAPPILVAEPRGMAEALRRSWRLTSGRRIPIFLLSLLYAAGAALWALALLALFAVTQLINYLDGWAVLVAFGALLSIPASVVAAAGLAAIRRELVGPTAETMGAMFE